MGGLVSQGASWWGLLLWVATSIGASSSVGSSSMEVLVEAGGALLGIVTPVRSSRDPSCDVALSRMGSLEKDMYGSIVLLSSRMHLAKRSGQPGIGRLVFSTQKCRACTQATVFCDCSSLISQQGNMGSEVVGMPSARYI